MGRRGQGIETASSSLREGRGGNGPVSMVETLNKSYIY